MLELKNIKKTYHVGSIETKALDGISVSFRDKEFVAILGVSGSGKTTCLNIIGGLDRYDSGELTIKGKKTSDFSDSDWDAYRSNSIGFVFQSFNLIPHLSIVDNVEMGMTLSGVRGSEKKKRALDVLKQVGLEDHLHKKPNQLSGGIMNGITIVLIAFASISLFVSLIMIGIITYTSVLERTKEIGILRALGARKKDITRVFDAETVILGLFSGVLGIAIAYLLTIPINIILYNLTDLSGVANLQIQYAVMLVLISTILTVIGGHIPAIMASKKEAVDALRTE